MQIHEYKVLVTGGSGFLGSHILKSLKKRGSTQCFSCSRRTGIDLKNFEKTLAFLKEIKPDIIINCAAHQGGIRYQQIHPGTIYYDNLVMGANMMEAARRVEVKKYVNIVAGCSYPGEYEGGVMKEENYWDGPLHESVVNYGITKKVQTIQGRMYKKQFGFNSIHIILSNLYGPGDHFEPDRSHALAALLRKFHEAKMNNTPYAEVWGTGKPIREWLYVEDAAEGLIRAAEVYDEVKPINMGTGIGHTIAELAQIIQRIMGYKGRIQYDTSKPDGATKKVMDVTKMKNRLGWMPKTDIETGIRKTYDWYLKNLGSKR